jgi:DNA-binding NarL/FixJ family response regulator
MAAGVVHRLSEPDRARVRVGIVHGDSAIRDGVAARLAAEDLTIVALAESPDDLELFRPDVVVVVHRHTGASAIDVCERLRGVPQGPKIVVLAYAARAVLLRRVIQAGSTGFVDADSPAAVLRDAVRAACSGRAFIDPALGTLVVELIARAPADSRPYGLTRAQLDVVALLPKGLPNREIAAELGISENTVKTHLRHALRKLNVRDRAQAAALVVREGLA